MESGVELQCSETASRRWLRKRWYRTKQREKFFNGLMDYL